MERPADVHSNNFFDCRPDHAPLTNFVNPGEVYVTVPANKTVEISALSKAQWIQLLMVQDMSGGSSAVFEGSGENVIMKALLDSGEHVETWDLGIASNDRKLCLVFAFKDPSQAGSPKTASRVQPPIYRKSRSGEHWTITSEDSTDNDMNDTIAFIDAFDPPSVQLISAGTVKETDLLGNRDYKPGMASSSNSWSLHGKIGYADLNGVPPMKAMSQFNAVVDWDNIPSLGDIEYLEPANASALNWHVAKMHVSEEDPGPVQRYICVVRLLLDNCDIPGMQGAKLQLQTWRSYFFTRPRGQYTDVWEFHQDGGLRKVNRVRD